MKIQEHLRLEEERAQQLQKDRETIVIFLKDISIFNNSIGEQLSKRQEQKLMQEELLNQINEEKRKRMDAKSASAKSYWRTRR